MKEKIKFHERKVEESENLCLVCANFIEILKGKKVQSNEKKLLKSQQNKNCREMRSPCGLIYLCAAFLLATSGWYFSKVEQTSEQFYASIRKISTRVATVENKRTAHD